MNPSEQLEPLVELVRSVLGGEISPDEAITRARSPEIHATLTDDLAIFGSRSALRMSRESADSWRPAVILHKLIDAAFDALHPDREIDACVFEMAWNSMAITGRALHAVPDPTLLEDAIGRGERCIASAKRDDQKLHRARLLHVMASLYLDPYAARPSIAISEQMRLWRMAAFEGRTWNRERYLNLEEAGYPPVADALAKARRLYGEASELLTGRERGRTLKALCQVESALHMFELPFDRDALVATAREALGLLDPTQDADFVAELRANLDAFGVEGITAGNDAWMDQSVDASVAFRGKESTRMLIVHTGMLLIDTDPARAFRLLLDALPLFQNLEDVRQASGYQQLLLRAFSRMQGFRAKEFLENDEPLEAQANHAIDQARRESWDPARLAGALIALAEASVGRDEEHKGVALLDHVPSVAPATMAPLRFALDGMRAQLQLGEGVNAVNREDWDGATRWYAAALRANEETRSPQFICELLERLHDVCKRGGSRASDAIVEILFDRTDEIELTGGSSATQLLQEIYRSSADAILDHGGSASTLWSLVQLAKGRRFAAMIAAGSSHRMTPDERDPELLARIETAREEADDEAGRAGMLGDAVLLTPYSLGSRLMGDDPAERLANLEHAYDGELHRRLVRASAGVSGLLATEEGVRGSLDDETVLLQYYFPRRPSPDRKALLLSALTTREGTQWTPVCIEGADFMQMTTDGLEIENSYVGSTVYSLRAAVQEDPGDDDVLSADGRRVLEQTTDLLIGPIAERLAELRSQGKTQLCVVPHGPLAFAPLHLLGRAQPLAEDWTVTYLPNLQLLSTHQGGPSLRRSRRDEVAAFGLSFAGGKDAILEAVSEARAVALSMGTQATLDDDATEGAVRRALLDSRYVHIATHGNQRPLAPSFQKLCLAPDEGDDGNLYAYELLGLDLRGLELVSLSACETALGRYDEGDNPHGLPATLFLAGARTIIGTLWEAETTCSAHFFAALYEALGNGATKLEAFRTALASTRERHPEYRDWGTFYFAGDWH